MNTLHPGHATCSVIELRQYTLHPGRCDELIELFEREFIDSQESLGLHVLGIFRDLDAPDRFVWLRGFAHRAARVKALQAFYGGPVWQRHRDAANATMIDSDDVLLLRPTGGHWPVEPAGIWHALICRLRDPALLSPPLMRPLPAQALCFDTDPRPNDFPRLPVRAGAWQVTLAAQPPALFPAVEALLASPPVRLRLEPTPRSILR